MVDGLIGFRVLQDNIQIIAKIIVKVEWLGNIVYPPEKADMLVFKIVRVYLFSSAGQQNITNLCKCSRRTNLPLKSCLQPESL